MSNGLRDYGGPVPSLFSKKIQIISLIIIIVTALVYFITRKYFPEYIVKEEPIELIDTTATDDN